MANCRPIYQNLLPDLPSNPAQKLMTKSSEGHMASLDLKIDFYKFNHSEIATKLGEIGRAREASL